MPHRLTSQGLDALRVLAADQRRLAADERASLQFALESIERRRAERPDP
ncbi:MAG: hypothetical protein ACRDM0_04580 [Thermoleophilaceae bacterium]